MTTEVSGILNYSHPATRMVSSACFSNNASPKPLLSLVPLPTFVPWTVPQTLDFGLQRCPLNTRKLRRWGGFCHDIMYEHRASNGKWFTESRQRVGGRRSSAVLIQSARTVGDYGRAGAVKELADDV